MSKISKKAFKIVARLNKIILPSYARKDLSRLSKFDKMVIGYRYWITKNSLPD